MQRFNHLRGRFQHANGLKTPEPTCCMIRVEVSQEVVLAAWILEVEAVNHEVGAIYPLDVLHLLCHGFTVRCCWGVLSALLCKNGALSSLLSEKLAS